MRSVLRRLRRHEWGVTPQTPRNARGPLRLDTLEDRTAPAAGQLDYGFAGTGQLTTSFGPTEDSGRAVAVQADGRVVVAGYASTGSNTDFTLARYLPDGRLDSSFGAGGKVTTDIASGYDFAYA